jgi:hypothetical protein
MSLLVEVQRCLTKKSLTSHYAWQHLCDADGWQLSQQYKLQQQQAAAE